MSQTDIKGALESIKDNLVNREGETVKLPASCDLIGIYFSAHWCPPCKGFTPKLVEFYEDVRKNDDKFQIVFVSFDKDETAFKDYFDTMPWLALKFDDKEIKETLAKVFQVSGIPMLVVLDAEGNIKDSNGRSVVDPEKPQEAMAKWRK